jgi:drug/metabolite transporter (DMT)-like permease
MPSDATTICTVPARRDGQSAGAVIVALAAVAFSTAGLFTRLITVDVWTMLFWRGLFGGLLVLAFILWRERSGTGRAFAGIGRAGLVVAACSTIATICFIAALRATTVADVTLVYATAPFLAAALSWMRSGERPAMMTLAASVLALIGVGVLTGGALSGGVLSGGSAEGDLLALVMTALMALMMVVIRENRHVSMLPASCLSAFACAVLVLPLAQGAVVDAKTLGLLGLFGSTQFGLGLLLLTIGSRLVSAPRASLLANLELPFAPLWVWLAFGETPAPATMLGGGIVCAAVLLDLLATNRPASD